MLSDKPSETFLKEAESIYFHYAQLNVLRDKFTGNLAPSEILAVLDAYGYGYEVKLSIFEAIIFIEELRQNANSGNRNK